VRGPVHIPDILADPEYFYPGPRAYRAMLGVPVIVEGELMGVVVVVRREPQPFTAERSMYFLYPGGISGGDATVGATSLSTTAYFAEGYTGPGFHESLQLFNPDPRQAATALVTYFFAGSREPKTVSHAVPAASRLTLDVADPAEAGPNQAVSVLVMSDFPLLSERTIYFQTGRESGGSVVVGARNATRSPFSMPCCWSATASRRTRSWSCSQVRRRSPSTTATRARKAYALLSRNESGVRRER